MDNVMCNAIITKRFQAVQNKNNFRQDRDVSML